MLIKDIKTLKTYYKNLQEKLPKAERRYQSYFKNVLPKLMKIKKVDLAVFIPFFDEVKNIKYVINTVAEGLNRYYKGMDSVIICTGSPAPESKRVLNVINGFLPKCNVRIIPYTLNVYGKGFGLRSCWELALALKIKAWATFDADLRCIKGKGFTPEWVKLFLDPVLKGKKDFVLPNYSRHYFDGTITNFVVRPLIASYWGYRIEQPIGGDFAGSRKMAGIFLKDPWVWYKSEAGSFGIDIFETIKALETGNLVKIYPGVKVHKPSAEEITIEGGKVFKLMKMVEEVSASIFYWMHKSYGSWTRNKKLKSIETWGTVKLETPEEIELDFSAFLKRFKINFKKHEKIYSEILPKDLYKEIRRIYRRFDGFPLNLWARLLHYYSSHSSHSDIDKKVIESFAPLHQLQIANFIHWMKKRKDSDAKKYFEKLEEEMLKL
jgi:hypothetical protein